MRKFWIIISLFTVLLHFHSQGNDVRGIRYGFKIPYSYDLTYYQRFNTKIALYGGLQLTSVPFQNSSIKIMEFWGGDVNIASILDQPYVMGTGIDIGSNFYLGKKNKFYFSAAFQWMDLFEKDIEDMVINNALGVDISKLPEGPIPKFLSEHPLTINSNYLNLALGLGKSINLKSSRYYVMNIEFQLSKTIASHHFLNSDYRYLTPIQNKASNELKILYLNYGWFPLINIYFIRMF